jgi:hypothetical protein
MYLDGQQCPEASTQNRAQVLKCSCAQVYALTLFGYKKPVYRKNQICNLK